MPRDYESGALSTVGAGRCLRVMHRAVNRAGAAILVVAVGVGVSGCAFLWPTDYGPIYSTPTATGSPVVSHDDVVAALAEQDFDVDAASATMRFGLKRDTQVRLALGTTPELEAARLGGLANDDRAVCNVSVSVFRDGNMPPPGQPGRAPSDEVNRAFSMVKQALVPHCRHGEKLVPAQLADAVWESGINFEVRMHAGSQVFPPALELGASGGYGEGDDGWGVSARIYENETAANEAMEQQKREDDFQSEPGSGSHDPDLFELFIGSHYQSCNVMISFHAQLGDGPQENPYVKRARQADDRADDAAAALREDCEK